MLHDIQHNQQPISYYYDLLSVRYREFDENQPAALFWRAAKFDNKVINEEKFCLCRFASYKEAYQANVTEQIQPVTTRA